MTVRWGFAFPRHCMINKKHIFEWYRAIKSKVFNGNIVRIETPQNDRRAENMTSPARTEQPTFLRRQPSLLRRDLSVDSYENLSPQYMEKVDGNVV